MCLDKRFVAFFWQSWWMNVISIYGMVGIVFLIKWAMHKSKVTKWYCEPGCWFLGGIGGSGALETCEMYVFSHTGAKMRYKALNAMNKVIQRSLVLWKVYTYLCSTPKPHFSGRTIPWKMSEDLQFEKR